MNTTADWNNVNHWLYFLANQIGQSKSIIYNDGYITAAKLTAIVPSGSFNYFLSADGGSNWESVSSGVSHNFLNAGIDLRWKIVEAVSGTGKITSVIVEKTSVGPAPSTLLTGIRAYYKFDTNLNDSVDSYNGTNFSTTSTTGIINNGRNMTPGYIELPQATIVNVPFTINMWMYANSLSGQSCFVSKRTGGPHSWDINQNSTLFYIRLFGVGSTNLNPFYNGLITTGSWQMITITIDGATSADIHVYKNSIEVPYSGLWSDNLVLPLLDTTNIRLGVDGGGTNFDGTYDELGIWDRALTPAEVTELYNSGTGLSYPF